jgi:hypothetical protein
MNTESAITPAPSRASITLRAISRGRLDFGPDGSYTRTGATPAEMAMTFRAYLDLVGSPDADPRS